MCIACAIDKGAKITEKEFEHCWDNNSDGGGFCYIGEDKKFVVFKSLKYDEFKKAWKFHHDRHGKYSPFLLHFRIKSQGEISIANCHPFQINPNAMMIHNGNISGTGANEDKDKKSDSRLFAEWLGGLPMNFYKNPATNRLISSHIGVSNKVAILDKNGEFFIYNRKAGEENNDGRWFSNGSFKWSKSTTTTPICPLPQQGYLHTTTRPNFANNNTNYLTSPLHECAWCGRWFGTNNKVWNHAQDRCMGCWEMAEEFMKKTGLNAYKAKSVFDAVYKLHPGFEDRGVPVKTTPNLSIVPTQDETVEAYMAGVYGL